MHEVMCSMAKTVDLHLVFYIPLWVGTVKSLIHDVVFDVRNIANIAEVNDECNSLDEAMEKSRKV